MKRTVFSSLSFVMVLTLLFTTAGSAIAAPLGGGPTISAPSGGGTVTLTVVPVSKLPGTEMNDVGTIFPQGHTNGDMMFSGEGVSVSGLVGYATLSMPLANYTAGWSGSIYQWLNESWVVLPTTITPNEEGPDAVASATVYSNGTFALITGYKLPDTGDNKCGSYRFSELYGAWNPPSGIIYGGGVIYGRWNPTSIPEGAELNYRVISLDPEITFEGDTSGTVIVTDMWSDGDGYYGLQFAFAEEFIYVSHDGATDYPPFIFRVFVNGCKVDFVVDFEE